MRLVDGSGRLKVPSVSHLAVLLSTPLRCLATNYMPMADRHVSKDADVDFLRLVNYLFISYFKLFGFLVFFFVFFFFSLR